MNPADLSRLHGHAVYDLLAPLEDPPTSYQRFFAKVDKPDDELRYPYLVVWAQPGVRTPYNFTGDAHQFTATVQLTAVGNDDDEVLAVLDRAAALLAGVRPTIDGRNPGLVQQLPTSVPVTPTDVARTPSGQPYYMAISLWSLTSTAAPS